MGTRFQAGDRVCHYAHGPGTIEERPVVNDPRGLPDGTYQSVRYDSGKRTGMMAINFQHNKSLRPLAEVKDCRPRPFLARLSAQGHWDRYEEEGAD